MKLRRILLAAAALAALGAGFMVWRIGPRNVIGMLLYDQRREGAVKVGDPAPDVELHRLDAGTERLSAWFGERPVVLVFGSFT
jgi:hypothetical protein